MKLNSVQALRIVRIVNEYHPDSVTIKESDDIPNQEVYVDFHVPTGTIEGVITQYGTLTTYDDTGLIIGHYSD